MANFLCLGSPRSTTRFSECWEDSQTQHVVVAMTMIYYSKRILSKMQEKQVSKSPLLVQSHRTNFILLTVSCVNKLWNLSTREIHLRLSAQGFIGVGHIGSLCLGLLTFQTPQRKDMHGKPRCLYKELRHSEPHLSGNGGNFSET